MSKTPDVAMEALRPSIKEAFSVQKQEVRARAPLLPCTVATCSSYMYSANRVGPKSKLPSAHGLVDSQDPFTCVVLLRFVQ